MNAMTDAHVSMFDKELKGFVYKRIKDKALAEDIVHDVFLKVSKHSAQLKDSEKLSAWIYQITRNTIIDHYRKNSKSIERTLEDWEYPESNYNECAANCLQELIPSLPEKYRIPFQLADVEKLSQTALTERLGISYSGVKSRVQRARKMLKEKLHEMLIIETDAYGNVIVCEDR